MKMQMEVEMEMEIVRVCKYNVSTMERLTRNSVARVDS